MSLGSSDFLGNFAKQANMAIGESMVEMDLATLTSGLGKGFATRSSNEVDDGNRLGKASGDSICGR
jgi:hypothetical protein